MEIIKAQSQRVYNGNTQMSNASISILPGEINACWATRVHPIVLNSETQGNILKYASRVNHMIWWFKKTTRLLLRSHMRESETTLYPYTNTNKDKVDIDNKIFRK